MNQNEYNKWKIERDYPNIKYSSYQAILQKPLESTCSLKTHGFFYHTFEMQNSIIYIICIFLTYQISLFIFWMTSMVVVLES